MKICLISNLKESGYGESTRPYFLARELSKQGHSILHLCHRRKQVEGGISYLHINPFGENNNSWNRAANFAYLWYHIRQFNPDIIYPHQFNNARWAIATRTLPRAPIVFDAHTSVPFEARAFGASKEVLADVFGIEKEICDRSDYIIAASYPTRELLMELYKVRDKKLFVVENATSIQPVSEPYITSNDKFICSATLPFDGFQSNEMALEFLFRIALRMNEIDRDVEFRVIGGGVKPSPPSANIIYTGYVADYEKSLLQSDACLGALSRKRRVRRGSQQGMRFCAHGQGNNKHYRGNAGLPWLYGWHGLFIGRYH